MPVEGQGSIELVSTVNYEKTSEIRQKIQGVSKTWEFIDELDIVFVMN